MRLGILSAESVHFYSNSSRSADYYVTDEAYRATCSPRHMHHVCYAGLKLPSAPQLHGRVSLPLDSLWSRGRSSARRKILQLLPRFHHVLRYVFYFICLFLTGPTVLCVLHGFIGVHSSRLGSWAQRLTINLEKQGLHFVRPNQVTCLVRVTLPKTCCPTSTALLVNRAVKTPIRDKAVVLI
jgi:hypothetical protein